MLFDNSDSPVEVASCRALAATMNRLKQVDCQCVELQSFDSFPLLRFERRAAPPGQKAGWVERRVRVLIQRFAFFGNEIRCYQNFAIGPKDHSADRASGFAAKYQGHY
jgi:hypothetical protein